MYLPEVKFYVEKRGSQLVAVAERGRGRGTGADTDIVDLCSSYLDVPRGISRYLEVVTSRACTSYSEEPLARNSHLEVGTSPRFSKKNS